MVPRCLSVILSLQKSGVKQISVVNRTIRKMFFFQKKKFKSLHIVEWNNLQQEINNYEIIINATSLGLKNGEKILIFKF